MSFQVVKAVRSQVYIKAGLSGPSGSGKTYSALLLAKSMGKKVVLIDAENRSASLYADKFDFDTIHFDPPYSPERYIEAIDAALAAGADVILCDSMTHEWSGPGGVLEIHDKVSKRTSNSYTAWGQVTPRHNAFIAHMLQCKAHVICTLRSKQDYVLEENAKGKQVPKKKGMKPIQRDDLEYEFTFALDIDAASHLATVSKDRTGLFDDQTPFLITEEHGKMLMQWLSTAEPAQETKLTSNEANQTFSSPPDETKISSDSLKKIGGLMKRARASGDEMKAAFSVQASTDLLQSQFGELLDFIVYKASENSDVTAGEFSNLLKVIGEDAKLMDQEALSNAKDVVSKRDEVMA